jgi:arginyl-tRNA synthetase
MENPVYYVQYAHARIASIGRRSAERGITRLPILDADLAPLIHDRELELLRALAAYPDVVADAAALRAPHRITTWVRDFAKEFHGFYRDCRVISDDVPLTQARLWLAEACRLGRARALAILGVHAPDEMQRLSTDDGLEADAENDE